jgi:flavin reductase (DIM6/NTAB) family NADH-FMN oxidoreductase RutF
MAVEQRFRDLMAGVCASVSVIATQDGEGPHGATVSSLASLSLRPPLITIALDRRSRLLSRVMARRAFAVNVLAAGQDDVAQQFTRQGVDRFAGAEWSVRQGLPRLGGVAGWAACDLRSTVAGGDHMLLIGEVTDATSTQRPTLVYGYRTYGTHSGFHARPRLPITDFVAACVR